MNHTATTDVADTNEIFVPERKIFNKQYAYTCVNMQYTAIKVQTIANLFQVGKLYVH